MRIGLDIDNVITDFDKKLLEEFYKEDKKKRNKGIVNPNGNWIKNMFDCIDGVKKRGSDKVYIMTNLCFIY